MASDLSGTQGSQMQLAAAWQVGWGDDATVAAGREAKPAPSSDLALAGCLAGNQGLNFIQKRRRLHIYRYQRCGLCPILTALEHGALRLSLAPGQQECAAQGPGEHDGRQRGGGAQVLVAALLHAGWGGDV
jgi:hypothetical protein